LVVFSLFLLWFALAPLNRTDVARSFFVEYSISSRRAVFGCVSKRKRNNVQKGCFGRQHASFWNAPAILYGLQLALAPIFCIIQEFIYI